MSLIFLNSKNEIKLKKIWLSSRIFINCKIIEYVKLCGYFLLHVHFSLKKIIIKLLKIVERIFFY